MQVAALFHIASADHGPELPKGLSDDGRDFLRLCFNRCGSDGISMIYL